MTFPASVRKLYPDPLTLEHAIELLYESDDVPDSVKPALKSTALDAVRYALRTAESEGVLPSKQQALATDVRPLMTILPASARVAAEEKNHQEPADHEGRVRRFLEVLIGRRDLDKTRQRIPCPPAWQPLVDAIPDRKNANGEMGFLSRCCRVAGVSDAPVHMPSYEEIVEAAHRINGDVGIRRAKKASMPQYRTAQERLLDRANNDEERQRIREQFAPLPTANSSRTCHLGVEPEAEELLRSMGLEPEGMTTDEMFREIAPELAADYDWWIEKSGNQNSKSFKSQCWQTLLRVAGWLIRAGHLSELADTNLLNLFLRVASTGEQVSANPRVAAHTGNTQSDEVEISLLEDAAEAEAPLSLQRSTVTDPDVAGVAPDGRPWFTQAMHQNCSRIWTMTADIFREIRTKGEKHAAEWALAEARWERLQKKLAKDRALPAEHYLYGKDKLRAVQTVTLPQLVCVGLPLRRREIHRLRGEWLAARRTAEDAGHARPLDHPVVKGAEERYFEAALPFTILSLAVDDGLRKKQYTRGRLGHEANFSPEFEFDAYRNPIGLISLKTTWSGDKRDPAHLKITEKNKKLALRADRRVRQGFVDHVVLWDLISHWRPRELVANGAYADLQSYDLENDVQSGSFALFPSNQDVDRPDKSRTDIGDLAGRELHYIVRKWLRPDLPEWGDLGDEWREIWAIHITRLLIGSYWGGARKQWDIASYLTMDTEQTLRSQYSEIDAGLRDRLGKDKTNWEHLNAYDLWMDRLYYDHEEFDPLEDPDLPLPPHLEEMMAKEEPQARTKFPIRRARPQQKPSRDKNGRFRRG